MSFGIVQSAIATIKNNRNLLSKRDRLTNTLSSSVNEKPEYDLPKSTPQSIKRIKEKIQRENKIRTQKRLVLASFLIVMLISIFVYFVF